MAVVLHQNTVAPLAARELSGKRKREQSSESDSADKAGQEENVCPNGGKEKAPAARKVRGQSRQKLFGDRAESSRTKTGEEGERLCGPQTRQCLIRALRSRPLLLVLFHS